MLQALRDGQLAPFQIIAALLCAAAAFVALGDLQEPFRGVLAARQDHIFHALAQLRIDIFVNGELAGIDDAHGEPGADGVIQKHRVHGFAHAIVAAKRKRHIADAAAGMRRGHALFDGGNRLDEVQAVAVMLLDARGHREDVRIENNILGRKLDLLGQNPVRALADAHFALDGIRLAFLIESHHHHRGAVAQAQSRMRQERFLAFLEADGIDDALALDAFEARFDHRPFRRVDHDGHARDIRLAGDQAQEFHHRRLRVQHALIHVHIDDLRAIGHLLTRHVDRGGIIARFNQLAKFRRAGDVGALADVDEQAAGIDGQGLQAAQAAGRFDLGKDARRETVNRTFDGLNVLRCRAAAATDHIDEAAGGEVAQRLGGLLGGLVILAECIGQSGIRIGADVDVGDARELFDIGPQLLAAERAIQSHHQRPGVADGIPKRFGRLARQGAPRCIGDRAGDDDGQLLAHFVEHLAHGEQRGLGI